MIPSFTRSPGIFDNISLHMCKLKLKLILKLLCAVQIISACILHSPYIILNSFPSSRSSKIKMMTKGQNLLLMITILGTPKECIKYLMNWHILNNTKTFAPMKNQDGLVSDVKTLGAVANQNGKAFHWCGLFCHKNKKVTMMIKHKNMQLHVLEISRERIITPMNELPDLFDCRFLKHRYKYVATASMKD